MKLLNRLITQNEVDIKTNNYVSKNSKFFTSPCLPKYDRKSTKNDNFEKNHLVTQNEQ